MQNAFPISMNDLKDFIGYYDWSNNITLRARTGVSGTNATVKYESKDVDVNVKIGDSVAITIDKPIKNSSDNVIVGGTSDYTRKITAHIRGAFRVVDGTQTMGLMRADSDKWTRIYIGAHEVTASVMVDIFPGDSVLIIAGDSIESSYDPYIVQFIPWKHINK
jgi:hypothetical protein